MSVPRAELDITRDLEALEELYAGVDRDDFYTEQAELLYGELSSIGVLGRVATGQENEGINEGADEPELVIPERPKLEIGPKTIGWLSESCLVEFDEVKTPNNQRLLWTDITNLQHRFAGVLSKRGQEQKQREKLMRVSQVHMGAFIDLSKSTHLRVEGSQDAFNIKGMVAYKDTPHVDWRSVMLRTEVDGLPAILFACLYPKNREDSFLSVLKRNGLR